METHRSTIPPKVGPFNKKFQEELSNCSCGLWSDDVEQP